MQRRMVILFLGTCCLWSSNIAAQSTQPEARILIVVGPSNHAPGSHEVAAGARLMQHCLNTSPNMPHLKADVVYGWPTNEAQLDAADTIVFIGDTFPPNRFPGSDAILAKLGAMMNRGCGIVCVHYATGLRADDVAADGEHPLLHWMGGYFATRCPHHQSIAKIYPAAQIVPAAPNHPVSRGWQKFTLHDEPYINNYFGKDENKLADNVTALATSMLPPEAPQREVVSWCVQRDDGGRGFGIVMPHFYRSWKISDLRTFILNAVVWTAGQQVPATGVQSDLPRAGGFQARVGGTNSSSEETLTQGLFLPAARCDVGTGPTDVSAAPAPYGFSQARSLHQSTSFS